MRHGAQAGPAPGLAPVHLGHQQHELALGHGYVGGLGAHFIFQGLVGKFLADRAFQALLVIEHVYYATSRQGPSADDAGAGGAPDATHVAWEQFVFDGE
jgi:hypothetical protein